MTAKLPDAPPNLKSLKEGRERWLHEDNLINHRLTWLGATQTLLFAGQGIVVQQLAQSKNDDNAPYKTLLDNFEHVLPWVGFISALLIFFGVFAATIAMIRIKRIHHLPTYGISLGTTIGGWAAAIGLPFTFLCAWSTVIQKQYELYFVCVALFVLVVCKWYGEVQQNKKFLTASK